MQRRIKSFTFIVALALCSAMAIASCGKSPASDGNVTEEHPADSTEHPAGEHPNHEHPSDSAAD